MKKSLRMLLLTMIVSSLALAVVAQEDEEETSKALPKVYPTPQWISEKGYWQIESNIKTPRSSIIYFYNNDGVLVYKENVEKTRLKLNKKRVLMCLKTVLEQTVTAWEQKHKSQENRSLLAVELKR